MRRAALTYDEYGNMPDLAMREFDEEHLPEVGAVIEADPGAAEPKRVRVLRLLHRFIEGSRDIEKVLVVADAEPDPAGPAADADAPEASVPEAVTALSETAAPL
jgi:hypothetical protein